MFRLIFLLAICIQIFEIQAVILKGCGHKDEIDEYQLQSMQIQDIQNKFLGREACCPNKPAGSYLLHIPKCGGTSMRKMLQSYFDAGGLEFCKHEDNLKIADSKYYLCVDSPYREQYLEQIYQGRFLKECTAIASHNDATLLDRLDTREQSEQKQLLDIVVLRRAAERQLSELKMVNVVIKKQNISIFQDQKEHFLHYIARTGNRMTKFLSGFYNCYDFSQPIKGGLAEEIDLKKALMNLSQFCVIIIMEQPECGLRRLASILNYQDHSSERYPYINPGVDFQFDDDYVRTANSSNYFDDVLYEYALQLNRQQCEQLGVDPEL